MPRPPATDLTVQKIDELKAKGFNQNEIADLYGLTPAAVSYIKRQAKSFNRTAREMAMENMPFQVPRPLQRTTVYQRVTDHLEYMFDKKAAEKWSDDRRARLTSFHNKLRQYSLVVVFDPEIPPKQGIKCGGWDFAPRQESDANLIIRANEHANITDKARELLALPEADGE